MIKQIYNKYAIYLFICISTIIIFVFLIGIDGQEKASPNLVRSSSLSIISKKNEETDRIDYVNEHGEITYAADKHYATLIRTKKDNSILEQYFDDQGNPAKQRIGHYAVLYSYNTDGYNNKVTYLDETGQPMITNAGYAVIIRTYNENGSLETEYYYDNKERPVKTYTVCSGCKRLYDDNGNNTTLIYLDAEGKTARTGQGYAIVHRTFYEEGFNRGRVKNEFYFDEYNNPIKLSNGQYGIQKEYDEYGRNNKTTFLGIDGVPIVSVSGYSSCKRTFYEDDSICTESYYDTDCNPIALSEGQYGVLYKNNNTVYLDINGIAQFNLKNILLENYNVAIMACLVLSIISAFSGKRFNAIVVLVYFGLVIYITLLYRINTGLRANFSPLWSYKKFFIDNSIRKQIIENIILFVPLGTMLFKLFPIRKAIIIIVLLSMFIEAMQYFTRTGLCELDDIISNSLGGLCGLCFGKLTTVIKQRIKSWKHI